MKTNHYESVVIINATLEDDQVQATLNRIQETFTANGAEVTNTDEWGRKRLAYPINKSKSGYYVVYRFTAPTEAIAKIERMYRLDETIIRYLTIVLDKKALENIENELKKSKDAKNEVVAPAVEAVADTKEGNDNEAVEKETN